MCSSVNFNIGIHSSSFDWMELSVDRRVKKSAFLCECMTFKAFLIKYERGLRGDQTDPWGPLPLVPFTLYSILIVVWTIAPESDGPLRVRMMWKACVFSDFMVNFHGNWIFWFQRDDELYCSDDAGSENSESDTPCGIALMERLIRSHPVWFLPGIQRTGAVHLLQGKEEGVCLCTFYISTIGSFNRQCWQDKHSSRWFVWIPFRNVLSFPVDIPNACYRN